MTDAKAPPPADGSAPETSGRSTWSWLLPALAFVLGVALGALVVAVGASGGDDAASPDAAATAGPDDGSGTDDEATPTPSGDAIVRVPAACLDAADGAEEVARQVDDVVTAARNLDARRLQELVDRYQELQPELQAQADACRDAAGERLGEGTLVTPAPSASG